MRKIAVGILVVSMATISMLSFSEPAIAAKQKKARAKPPDITAELDEATREFVKREQIPSSIISSGEIYAIRSYAAQFKAIRGNGAAIFTRPDTSSRILKKLNNGAKLIAEAEYTNRYGGDWYYVKFQNETKGWILSQYIVDRDPDENE